MTELRVGDEVSIKAVIKAVDNQKTPQHSSARVVITRPNGQAENIWLHQDVLTLEKSAVQTFGPGDVVRMKGNTSKTVRVLMEDGYFRIDTENDRCEWWSYEESVAIPRHAFTDEYYDRVNTNSGGVYSD